MDCSITKRKGCNYCLRGKDLSKCDSHYIKINDSVQMMEIMMSGNIESIVIHYCPICGKRF